MQEVSRGHNASFQLGTYRNFHPASFAACPINYLYNLRDTPIKNKMKLIEPMTKAAAIY